MKQIYRFLGWGVVAIGAAHMITTALLFDHLDGDALWFFSGGIAIAVVGALNLLNRVYGVLAPGLRRVCAGSNLAMTLFAIVAGIVFGMTSAQFPIVVGLFAGATALSLYPRSLVPAG